MKETLDADAEETADKIAVQDAKVERLCGGYYQKQQIIKDAMLMVFQHFSAVLNERLGQEERKVSLRGSRERRTLHDPLHEPTPLPRGSRYEAGDAFVSACHGF